MAEWAEPRTWFGGERGVSSRIMNQHIADNLQFLFDTYTNVRGVYRDISSYAIPSNTAFTEVTNLALTIRHEAILLTIVGQFPACQIQYRVDTNPDLVILNLTQARSVAKQVIIPSLAKDTEHTVRIFAQGTGTITHLQADIRELT